MSYSRVFRVQVQAEVSLKLFCASLRRERDLCRVTEGLGISQHMLVYLLMAVPRLA
jgi:hypothetical protein